MRRMMCLCMILAFAGCGEEQPPPNRPPDTSITSGPPQLADGISYRVDLAWSGSDPEGAVHHYDLILVDHPAAWDGVGDVVVTVPTVDDSRWRSTTNVDSTLVVSADALHLDPQSLPPGEVLQHFMERWHSVFVRAVDVQGVPDPTPDYRTFNARTLAPTIALASPVIPAQPLVVPPNSSVLRWTGEDPIDKVSTDVPRASRWTVVPILRDTSGNFAGFTDTLYSLPPEAWTPWQDWYTPGGPGVRATVTGLEPASDTATGFYVFAVQAQDEAGAVTPVFDTMTPGKNNAAVLMVQGSAGPVLIVDTPLGTYSFQGDSGPELLDVAAGSPISLRWRGDASAYGSEIADYRYGWEIQNPDNPEEWEQNWCATCQTATSRVWLGGSHRFLLEARDVFGGVTRADLSFVVHTVTRARPLLFVDDATSLLEPEERIENARWAQVLDELRTQHSIDFDPSRDVYDVEAQARRPPPLALVFEYAAVIWCVRGSGSGTALRELELFVDPFLSGQGDHERSYHTLSRYLDNGGSLWVNGARPAQEVWPAIPPNPESRYPINVTNWDDPLEPHPGIDSVGVTSFLYRMGVEAFDIGNGTRALQPRRDALEHGCVSLRSAVGLPGSGLTADLALWPLPLDPGVNPYRSRAFVEIYNMLPFLASQVPPLDPSQRVDALYLFTSAVPEDPGGGIVYPLTADGQPAFLLAKGRPTDPRVTRAFCGFEPWRLTHASHLGLAESVIVEYFGIGTAGSPKKSH